MKPIYFHHTGPMITYHIDENGPCLSIEDLNPEVKIKWRVRRKELFGIGMRCMWAALWEQAPAKPAEI